ncbi:hypothetical protein T07_3339 [Trichinella nelsoni]|uniref:Uncharacterized protein n=1 Tax=Trichinella nelsoni TaxID=6336 RepID=A0A0V0SE17_9BILA|nr:hypothetical protein T07_3339 [Trichinella nelsoni]
MQSVQCSKSYREHMGLIVDRETLNVMDDQALRRLTYIAIQVAKRHEPTLNNLKYTILLYKAYFDKLIKKYFPVEVENPRGLQG